MDLWKQQQSSSSASSLSSSSYSSSSSSSDSSSCSDSSSGGDGGGGCKEDEDNGEMRSTYYIQPYSYDDVEDDKDFFGSKYKEKYDKTHAAIPFPGTSNAKQDRSINNKYKASIVSEQMDLLHNRARIIAKEDRISSLPNEIIHHILSFLDMKYAIHTSTLSKKWKQIWTSMPHLNFNSQTFRTLPQFAKFVNDALSHRNRCKEVSAVELSFRGAATEFDAVVRSIVNYAYSHNVRKLTIVWFRFNRDVLMFPQRLFSSHTLKHLTLETHYLSGFGLSVPNSAWDFPALETLNLSNLQFNGGRDKSLNLFCVNLKDLTLHQCSMYNLDIFCISAPQLSNLTITDPCYFPKVFNVVAPQLENLTASVCDSYSSFLQLSTEDLDSLEKVNRPCKSIFSKKRDMLPDYKICS